MGNARVLLTEELHDLVRDAVADVSATAGALAREAPHPRRRSPARERRAARQATILALPPPPPPAPLPAPPAAGPPEPAGPVHPPRRRAYLERIAVPSAVPATRYPARTRRVAVPCRRPSPLDVRRVTRMLRVAVPAASLGAPAALISAASTPAAAAPASPPPPAHLPLVAPPPEPAAKAGPGPRPAGLGPARPVEAVGHPRPPAAGVVSVPAITPPAEPPAVQAVALQAAPAPAPAAPAAQRLPAATPEAEPEEPPPPAPPRWRAVGGHLVNLLIAAALGLIVTFCAIVVGLVVTGHHLEQVVTGSMQPTIPIGSLVVTERVPVSQLHVGDILVFPNPDNSRETIVHRIVWLKHDSQGDVLVRTKGDYNALPDNWTVSRPAASDADIVHWIIPGAGTLAAWLQDVGIWGLIALVIGAIGWYGQRKVRQILHEEDEPADDPAPAETP